MHTEGDPLPRGQLGGAEWTTVADDADTRAIHDFSHGFSYTAIPAAHTFRLVWTRVRS